MTKPRLFNNSEWTTDRIIGLSAILISLCALIVSIYQTQIMQIQQTKAAWPHVRWYTQSGWDLDSSGSFKITVVNKGIGPAIIKKVDILLDNQKYSCDSIAEVIHKMYGKQIIGLSQISFDQTVILPNDVINFFELTDTAQAFEFAKIYSKDFENTKRFEIIIEYQDVYDNTFISSSKTKF